MSKDFKEWHIVKSKIENSGRLFFHERDVWFCHLGINIGDEQDGKGRTFGRPVIIFRKFNNHIFWGMPITTKKKFGRFYMELDLHDGVYRAAILSQLRLLDAKRLYQKIGVVETEIQKSIQKKITDLFRFQTGQNFKGGILCRPEAEAVCKRMISNHASWSIPIWRLEFGTKTC